MTISKYISDFLKEVTDITIDTNHVQDGSDKYGLFKSPGRTIRDFNDGSYEITENYQFMCKQNSTSECDRTDSDEFLENLTYAVDDFPYENDYPALDGGRKVKMISLTGCPYPMEADGKETLYQMSLAITYLRERTD